MRVGDYDIPEEYESMSCIHNCGFILVWERALGAGNVGDVMDTHLANEHAEREFPLFFRFRKGKND